MPLIAISVISAAIITYEILLMRLYSIVQWHHFAFMMISIALLGFGISGSFLALTRGWLLQRFLVAWQASAILFGVTAVLAFALAQRVPFNPLQITWEPRQLLFLGETYLLLVVPFFFGANCIGLAFAKFGDRIGRVYSFDLVGAGVGAIFVIGVLFFLPAETGVKLVLAMGFVAAGIAGLKAKSIMVRRCAKSMFVLAVLLFFAVPGSWIEPKLSEYKMLSNSLRLPDAKVVEERSSPLGFISVVESPTIPFRHIPGLSLNSTQSPPYQYGLFIDGDAMMAITRYEGQRSALSYLDYTTEASAYHLLDQPRVLVLGAGTGAGVLLAHYHDAVEIDAVEINPSIVDLMRTKYADFSGRIYMPEHINLYISDARAHIAGSSLFYDLIQISALGSIGSSVASGGLSETYGYTVEAFRDYLDHLRPQGLIVVTRPLKLPPRDTLKLVATTIAALRQSDITDPDQHIVLIRSWQTTTLLVKNGRFTHSEISTLKDFARARSFDLAYYPGMPRNEANQYNQLFEPYYYDGVTALLGPDSKTFLDDYKFDLRPATDNRPYFFHFFKWRTLPEQLSLHSQAGLPLIERGYLILVATLVQAAILSVVLVLLPLRALRKRGTALKSGIVRIVVYFLALGLAFLFIEIAFIQRLVLFLGHPLYAIAVVLAAFLIFAGLGAAFSSRFALLAKNKIHISPILAVVVGIGFIALIYSTLLPWLLMQLISAPALIKLIAVLGLIAPMAFFLGMPFPLGLAQVSSWRPEIVPWAWGINGCASVISPVLATILAMSFGFTMVVLLAVALYGVAAVSFPRT